MAVFPVYLSTLGSNLWVICQGSCSAMFVQEFETKEYLALHLPQNLENFTEAAFVHDIHHSKFSERDSKICVLETWLFVFHYTRQTKVMECSLRSLQISWSIYSKTLKKYLNDMWELKYKFRMRDGVLLGGRAKYLILLAKVCHLPAKLSSSLSQSHCELVWQRFQSLEKFEPLHPMDLKKWVKNHAMLKKFQKPTAVYGLKITEFLHLILCVCSFIANN